MQQKVTTYLFIFEILKSLQYTVMGFEMMLKLLEQMAKHCTGI